ncbi:MAG: hypothetical protein AB1472_04370 [Candidatus Omnitrophota bacterium]
MIKKIISSSLIVFFIFSVNIFASEPWNLKYTQIISSKSHATPITANILVKGKNVRMESSMQGQPVINIIKDGTTMYIYYPLQKMAMMTTVDKQAQEQLPAAEDYMNYMQRFNPKKISTEIYDGKNCDVYEYQDLEQKAKVKVWLWQAKKFPLKTIITTSDDVITSESKNVETNVVISNDMFELPPGTKINNMQDMMKHSVGGE